MQRRLTSVEKHQSMPLFSITKLYIFTNISSVQLPALQSLGPQGEIKILSHYSRINCTSSHLAYERALNTLKSNSPNINRADLPQFECRFENVKTPLTDNQKTWLGVGTGFAIVIFIMSLAILWSRLKERKQKRMAQEKNKEIEKRYAGMRDTEGLMGSQTTIVDRQHEEHVEIEEMRRPVSPM